MANIWNGGRSANTSSIKGILNDHVRLKTITINNQHLCEINLDVNA